MTKALFLLVGGDVLITLLAQLIALATEVSLWTGWKFAGLPLAMRWVLFAAVVLLTTYLVELYSMERHFDRKSTFRRILVSLSLSLAALLTIYQLFPQVSLDRGMVTLSLLLFGVCQFVWHDRYPFFLHARAVAKNVLILGTGPLAAQIGNTLGSSTHNYVLSGFVQMPGELATVPETSILAQTDQLFETAVKRHVDKIVVSLTERRGVLPVAELLQCRFHGIKVVDAVSFHEETTGKLLVDHTNPGWFIFASGFRITDLKCYLKGVFDFAAALVGLIIILPVFPLIALLIKIDSKGPIIFSQPRVGKNEKIFNVYKLRTMCKNAEGDSGAVWAQANDARITRVGRFLRKSRLDEIPQLINILKGDMALVGPRPERPEFVQLLKEKVPYYARRHMVKPGITGWAQVRFPYGASVEDSLEKLKYDLYYMKHFSPLMDLLIILETVKVVLFGRGGR